MPTGVGTAMLIGGGLSAGASLFGAHEQSKANSANLSAQQAQFEQLRNLIMPQIQNGTNPYAKQITDYMGGMNRYQNPGAFTADPSTIDLNALQRFSGPQAQAGGLVDLSSLGIGGPDRVNAQQLDLGGTQSQAFNTGQDAIMQMMRRDLTPQMDQGLTSQLNKYMGDTSVDTDNLLSSLAPGDAKLIDQQVSDLRGSAGSLGERLGSVMMDQERLMRGDFANQVGVRNAGIRQTADENSRARALQALGLATGREQSFAGLGLQAGGQQGQLAQQLAQLGLGQSDLLARLGISNQQAGLQAGMANQQAGLQAGMANQQANLSGQQTNADIINRIILANQQSQMQAGLANQGAYNSALGQNAGFLNQLGMFNAGQRTGADQFAAQQGNIFDQMRLSGMGQAAGIQQNQQGMNAQLLSILAGMGVPQQQPGQYGQAFSDIGSMSMMLPFLMQMGGGGGGQRPALPAGTNFQYPWLNG